MSTLKSYAKKAKERLKGGFWTEAKAQLKHEQEVAATKGLDQTAVVEQQRQRIQLQIFNEEEYESQKEFNEQVTKILESDQVILNPLQLLADETLLETLNEQDKQRYFLELAQKYRDAVELYNKQNNRG